MKKNLVLFTLFILPIVAYLFFASGINSFAKLPTITQNIPDLKNLDSKTNVTLQNKITILGFTGDEVLEKKGRFFNLFEEIYKKNREFKDFQIVMVVPIEKQADVEKVKSDLHKLGNPSGWNFVFATKNSIKEYYSRLKLLGNLNQTAGSNFVFIVDKNRNLRGRKGKSEKGKEEYKEGYNTTLASELHNEMTDDVKIILAEYRLALKKNNADRRKHGL
jgi:hypothetical protein